MRFIVLGAGAIGCVVGGRLHQHGHEVVLIGRGEHGEKLRSEGLHLEAGEEVAHLKVPSVATPDEAALRQGDVVLLATKSQHTAAALDQLDGHRGLTLVTLQNGVENERLALRRFSDVIACCVICPATFLEPGVVRADSFPVSGLLDLGRYPDGVDARVEQVAAAFAGSTFQSVPREDVMRWKYCKLLMNLGNAVEALCGPAARDTELARRARAEGQTVLRAAGIAFASEEEDKERRADHLKMKKRSGSSSWQSLSRGAGSIESDYLNGEIVLLGRSHGVPTPVNATLQRLANALAREGRGPGCYSLDQIEKEIHTDVCSQNQA